MLTFVFRSETSQATPLGGFCSKLQVDFLFHSCFIFDEPLWQRGIWQYHPQFPCSWSLVFTVTLQRNIWSLYEKPVKQIVLLFIALPPKISEVSKHDGFIHTRSLLTQTKPLVEVFLKTKRRVPRYRYTNSFVTTRTLLEKW